MSSDYTLAFGTHATAREGRCAMEWVSHLAGEPHGDAPACVSPVLRAFCVTLNDGLRDGPRQQLRPYLARTIGTAGDGLDSERAWMAMDWLIRTYAPAWLALAGLEDSARGLRQATPVLAVDELPAALGALGAGRRQAADAWQRCGAGRLARGRRARLRARTTVWSAPPAAAWAAARCGVSDMAGDRARAAARAIAGDAAAAVARATRHIPSHAQPAGVLSTTLADLQDSAFGLLDRMLPTMALPELTSSDRAPALA